MAITNTS